MILNNKTTASTARTSPNSWWHGTVFYEIYIASFQDSNDDGIGDFRGLTSRLDYLQELGITGLWITPFYPSPKVDNGYDVSDYCDVDPDFGSLADFDRFIKEAHKRGIKVIIDVVLNHVSTEHEWFKEAVSSLDNKYRDYFIFKDKHKTNNWESFFGGSSWEKDPFGQYYYHKFSVEQADLNWQNPAVKNEMVEMLKFWLNRGVDGFRLDVINFLSCSGIDKDNPVGSNNLQIHLNDIDQDGIFTCIADICSAVREHSSSLNKECFLVGEIGHDKLEKLAPYQRDDLLDVVFNFNLGSIEKFDIDDVYQQLFDMDKQLSGLPTLFFNSHDMPRSMSRLCNDDIDQAQALAALVLTLKGVSFLYFGEEIGMPDYLAKTVNDLRDVQASNHLKLALEQGDNQAEAFEKAKQKSRDKSRLFMQWNEQRYSGFTAGSPWIAGNTVIENQPNVEQQISESNSLWHWYRKLIALRSDINALSYGDYEALTLDDKLLSISRRWNEEVIHILINFDRVQKTINFNKHHEILASKGFFLNKTDCLLPYGVLITREI